MNFILTFNDILIDKLILLLSFLIIKIKLHVQCKTFYTKSA